jgi:hypothetical protein
MVLLSRNLADAIAYITYEQEFTQSNPTRVNICLYLLAYM